VSTTPEHLEAVLQHWLENDRHSMAIWPDKAVAAALPIYDDEIGRQRMAEAARPYLHFFLEDNSHRTADDLREIAGHLSPGGAHTGGSLAMLVRDHIFGADECLLAATIYHNWQGGKVGFQFLPDPRERSLEEYEADAVQLLELFGFAFPDPLRLLTGDDRLFFDSLPNVLTVYRGVSGISLDQARLGLCWTTSVRLRSGLQIDGWRLTNLCS
jgi:hypothetical protein